MRRPLKAHQLLGDRSRNKRYCNSMLDQPVAKVLGIDASVVIRYIYTCPGGEVGPQLPYGCIKTWTRNLRSTVRRLYREDLLMPADKILQAPMCYLHALGLAG